ncbi:hypothetical protein AB6A40_008958 [Gnathostoma spinigerum]|uniref:Uncharacterized protein n=1 Tax=Gnathostoma spinigerum TaxID=75299 RepID=A0ABD6EYC3_9BILA
MDDHAELEVECNRKRNLDRRRETSRYAARDRRGKEADIFTDLKEVVPIVEEATVTHVDRIALLRVASTLCRLRKNAGKLLRTTLCGESVRLWSETTVLESLDGFLAIIDSDGIILYVTESVSIYLGLTQIILLHPVFIHIISIISYNLIHLARSRPVFILVCNFTTCE